MNNIGTESVVAPAQETAPREWVNGPVPSTELILASYLPTLEENPPFVDFGKPQRRADAIASIVQVYSHHPLVEDMTGRLYRHGYEDRGHNLRDTVLDQTRADAKAYRKLPHDINTIHNYFKYIERGLATYVELDGKAPLPEEQQTLIDLTVAYQAVCLSSLSIVSVYLQKHKLINRRRANVREEDMFHDGYVGLLHATQRYDYSLDVPFWDFAEPWVRSAVQTGFRMQRSNIPLSHVDELRWLRVRGEYIKALNEGPEQIDPKLLATRADLTNEEVAGFLGHNLSHAVSLDDPLVLPHSLYDDWFVRDRIRDTPSRPTPPSDPSSDEHQELLGLIAEAQLQPSHLAVISVRAGVYLEQLAGTMIGKSHVSYDTAFEQAGGISNPTNSEVAGACGLSLSTVETYASIGMRALKRAALEPHSAVAKLSA